MNRDTQLSVFKNRLSTKRETKMNAGIDAERTNERTNERTEECRGREIFPPLSLSHNVNTHRRRCQSHGEFQLRLRATPLVKFRQTWEYFSPFWGAFPGVVYETAHIKDVRHAAAARAKIGHVTSGGAGAIAADDLYLLRSVGN